MSQNEFQEQFDKGHKQLDELHELLLSTNERTTGQTEEINELKTQIAGKDKEIMDLKHENSEELKVLEKEVAKKSAIVTQLNESMTIIIDLRREAASWKEK